MQNEDLHSTEIRIVTKNKQVTPYKCFIHID